MHAALEIRLSGSCNGRWCPSGSSFAELEHQHREVEITAHGDFNAQDSHAQDDDKEVGVPTDQQIAEMAAKEDVSGENREEDFLGKKTNEV